MVCRRERENPAVDEEVAPVDNLQAVGSVEGIRLTWNASPDPDILGYYIDRSTDGGSTYVRLISLNDPDAIQYLDTSIPEGLLTHYNVTVVRRDFTESDPVEATATRPAADAPPLAPQGLVLVASSSGILLDWSDNGESDLAGYNVYRSSSLTGTYQKLNSTLLATSTYDDVAATPGVASFYHVTALDVSGQESPFTSDSATRPVGNTAPAAPTGLTATASDPHIALNWNDNAEGDLAGYNVYRSLTSGGTLTKLNSSLVVTSTYDDTTATRGVVSYYKVSAVDNTDLESSLSSEASDTRPVLVDPPPAAPTALTATLSGADVVLNWADNIEGDLDGYVVYRSTGGAFSSIATPSPSTYTDSAAPKGTRLHYQVTAKDLAGGESLPTSVIITTPPAVPTNLTITNTSNSLSLDWDNNPESGVTYKVYRGTSSSGPFTLLTSSPISVSTYDDLAAPVNVASYYRVSAVLNGLESGFLTGNATRVTGFALNTSFEQLMAPATVHVRGLDYDPAATSAINESDFSYNFGDPTGVQNLVKGFNAAHVYENPGTYTITLTVTPATGSAIVRTKTITVTANTRTKVYVTPAGLASGSGSTPQTAVNLTRALALIADNTELLFERGKTFSDISNAIKIVKTNVCVSAYGNTSLERPKFDFNYQWGFTTDKGLTRNLLIRDIEILSDSISPGIYAVQPRGRNVNYLRLKFSNKVYYAFNGQGQNVDGLSIIACQNGDVSGSLYFAFLGGNDIFVAGNTLADQLPRIRCSQYNRITIFGNSHTVDPGIPSSIVLQKGLYGWIDSCTLTGTTNDELSAVCGPLGGGDGWQQDPDYLTVRAQYIVWRRNTLTNAFISLVNRSQYVLVKGNAFANGTRTCVRVEGTDPIYITPAQDAKIVNNTKTGSGAFTSVGSGALRIVTSPNP